MHNRLTMGASGEQADEESIVPFEYLFRIIRRRLALILVSVVLLTGFVVGFDLFRMPVYEASINVLIGQKQITDNLAGQEMGLQQLTLTMAEAVESRRVAEATIQKLDLQISPEEFLKNLSAEGSETTRFMQVHYRDPDPDQAREIANTIGTVFVDQASEVIPTADSVTTTVWERAVVAEDPVSPNFQRDVPLAVVLGLMLGIGLAFLLEYWDDDWRSPEEVEQVSGVPTFGVIPLFEILKGEAANDKTRRGTKNSRLLRN
jgi:capsular polysaccharide biosynthesis protein